MIDFKLGVSLKALEYSSLPLVWRNDPKIWRWTRQNDLLTKSSHQKWFDLQEESQTIKMYGIWHDVDWIGVCGLTSIDLANSNAEFSLYIGPEFHGKGFSKLALMTLFYHGFQNMGLHSIWGETFENNRAQKIFRDIGMNEDGRRRQFYFKDGKFWDAILFSVTNSEFIQKHGVRSCFG